MNLLKKSGLYDFFNITGWLVAGGDCAVRISVVRGKRGPRCGKSGGDCVVRIATVNGTVLVIYACGVVGAQFGILR